MQLPRPRGPVSAAVVGAVRGGPFDATATTATTTATTLSGADVQLALWTAYELGYRGFDDADADAERDLRVLAWRKHAEDLLEQDLRARTATMVAEAREAGRTVGERIAALVREAPGAPLTRLLQKHATREQFQAYLADRSVYHLKETDPQVRVLGWIDGPAKVAHAELLYDEYGGGRPERLHSHLFAEAMRAAGLDATYGAHVDTVGAATLLSNNVMGLFGSQRRLRGAALGHLAAFEATSTDPCRRIAAGAERVGFPAAVAAYFHEHVEADAVHEQVVLGDICGAAVAADPAIEDDVLLGAAACLVVDAEAARALHDLLVAEDARSTPVLRVVGDERAAS